MPCDKDCRLYEWDEFEDEDGGWEWYDYCKKFNDGFPYDDCTDCPDFEPRDDHE